MSLYVIQINSNQDKFLADYQSRLSQDVRDLVKDLLYFRESDKGFGGRTGLAVYSGYVFLEMSQEDAPTVHRALKRRSLGTVLLDPSGKIPLPLSAEESARVWEHLKTRSDGSLVSGAKVVVKEGPYDGLTGTITRVAGYTAQVEIQLKCSKESADIALDHLEISTGQGISPEGRQPETFPEWKDELEEDEIDPEDDGTLFLKELGTRKDPAEVLAVVEEIAKKHLTSQEGDLLWLLMQGRRQAEVAQVLKISEAKVVAVKKALFRKIRVVYTYSYHHDKAAFLEEARKVLSLDSHQDRVLTLFFKYNNLQQIADSLGTLSSNVFRTLSILRKHLDKALPEDSPHRFFLNGFKDLTRLRLRAPEE